MSLKIFTFGRVPPLDTKSGVSPPPPILDSLVWETRQIFLPPALPLSRSCQTQEVINPSNDNTAVYIMVLHNSVNKPLSDGHILSIVVHKQLVCICQGFTAWASNESYILTNRSGIKSLFWNWGINCPNCDFSFWSCNVLMHKIVFAPIFQKILTVGERISHPPLAHKEKY